MFSSMRLLFVDDEPDLQDVIAEICEELGIRLTAVGCAKDALDLLAEQDFDLVFSDLNMPVMNGIQLIEKAREIKVGIPFVLWSGFWQDNVVARLQSLGNVEFLDKPFVLDQFMAAMEKFRRKM